MPTGRSPRAPASPIFSSEPAGGTFSAPERTAAIDGLCARLGSFPELIQNAAADYAPHQIAFYLKDLAGEFHSWYNAERMLVDDEGLRLARLALAAAVRQVLANGFALL